MGTFPIRRRAMVWLAAIIVVINGFFPAVWILFTSLKTESELLRFPITYIPTDPTLQNYYQAFTEQPLLRFILNSMVVAGASTLLTVTVSALAAYALTRLRMPGRNLIMAGLLAISMFPLISLMVPLFKVVLPLAAPGVFTAAILAFVNAWDEFLLALTFMSRASMRTLSVGITLYQGEFAFPWPLISAALIVAIVPICILIALFQERVVGGLTSGGLKG